MENIQFGRIRNGQVFFFENDFCIKVVRFHNPQKTEYFNYYNFNKETFLYLNYDIKVEKPESIYN